LDLNPFHQARDMLDVAAQPVQLADKQLRPLSLRQVERLGELRPIIVLARQDVTELADDLPWNLGEGLEEDVDVAPLCFQPEATPALLCGAYADVGHISSHSHRITRCV